ncbi:shikimate dehydrogenase family protein [Allosphingosinicella vermicomposti]|uniref:shikimate dehydrogenase family protein n=1 Tax=Allosphingosinicella vermicomposti TaxID=614671 RepID=UPI000D10B133|nr:shikimate dehydrogenase [Allosphingosinicella vermicomposti]
MTRPYAEVIGDPVAHSKSPLIHLFWLDRLGMDGDYRAVQVKAADIGAYLSARQDDPAWRGCNVTMPLKQAIIPHLSALDATARKAGAVNLVGYDYIGRNSDVAGISGVLTSHELAADGNAHIIGTGGAARAAVAGVLAAGIGAAQIHIHGRDPGKAADLAGEMLGARHQSGTIARLTLANSGLLINATPLGMTGYPQLPILLDGAAPELIVYDLVYNPMETPLLQQARKRGLRVYDGLDMLIGQAAEAFALFFGAQPPRMHDADLKARLL